MKIKSIVQKSTTSSPLFRRFFNYSTKQFLLFLHISAINPAKKLNRCSSIQPNSKLMSTSHSFCLSSAKIPCSHLHHPSSNYVVLGPQKIPLFPLKKPTNYCFFRPITFQRIPTKLIVCSSQATPSATLQPIEELPPKLQEIVKLFQAVQEPRAKYEQLLFYGRNLKPLDDQYKTSENKVKGCVSQVWVRAYFDDDKNVVFEADSDSVLTKGLAALLVLGLSGSPVAEIVKVSPDFALMLGLQQSLTPSRNNGFLNMLKLMQKKALQLYVEAEKEEDKNSINEPSEKSRSNENESDNSTSGLDGNLKKDEDSAVSSKASNSGNSGVALGSRGLRIKEKLVSELKPIEIEVEDISYQHAGHGGVRGNDGETHFNLKVVSEEFEGKSLVKRHRLIYGLLQDELQNGLHALSIMAKAPSEMSS